MKDELEKLYSLKVSEFMDPLDWDMPIIEKGEPASHAFFMLRANGHVWVVESRETMKLVGALERVDILRTILPPESIPYAYGSVTMHVKNINITKDPKIEDIMVRKVIVAGKDSNLKDIMIKMRNFQLERLPVIDENEVIVGEITLKAIITYITKLLKESS